MPSATLIALFGPTGVGKTAVAVALADLLAARGERPVAVSADALQLYRGLEVLSGAADALAQTRLEHRLIGCAPVSDSFSAGRYAALAHAEIDALIHAGRRPIIVGGTGLYLRAALTDLSLKPPVDPALRAAVQARVDRDGLAHLYSELSARRPELVATIAPGDRQRITRALELLEAGADPTPPTQGQLWTAQTRHPTVLFGLVRERACLYARINARVEAMVGAGVVEEVAAAAAAGAGPSAAKALGFRELLAGDVDAMKRVTRRYARRQLTWMRKLEGVQIVSLDHRKPDEVAAEMLLSLDAASLPSRCDSRSGRPSATTT
ncbi:tRNA (adenosine(37)-N6)-dimethylallyltransferase MiaA [Conexibacter sp. DBS9H8]|uniref:tRNA (adenosine(37)-N6)-dimethylallyltransferase MiaA n=1 Tax=Conexibacter sp. DBS9H8 TaxID=2937801 RepID=UPI002010591C|nr:tRNA (adenosine(37)-N6)-dimethylallyltransferase MiaA [Conexibacter sp. DBS9H8]